MVPVGMSPARIQGLFASVRAVVRASCVQPVPHAEVLGRQRALLDAPDQVSNGFGRPLLAQVAFQAPLALVRKGRARVA